MNKWIELFVGLILIIGSILIAWSVMPSWGTAAVEFFKGGLVWLIILIGLLFVLLGISDIKG
jgi:hypothetical protein